MMIIFKRFSFKNARKAIKHSFAFSQSKRLNLIILSGIHCLSCVVCVPCRTLRWFFLILIRTYQKCISPFLGNHCRFYPSCSQYAHDAMTVYSIPKALYLTVRRLLRCHPFNPGGIDPVLPREHS